MIIMRVILDVINVHYKKINSPKEIRKHIKPAKIEINHKEFFKESPEMLIEIADTQVLVVK